MNDNKTYKHAGIGGTFDRLHQGHKELIKTALLTSKKITIGLTIDNFSNHKSLHQIIYSYKDRQKQLENYLSEIKQLNRVFITPLKDVYGPTISDSSIDCLVVTDQTYKGAEEINNKRRELNLSALPIIKANLIKDEEDKYLSSTRIRQGLVNRFGEIYKNLLHKEITFNHNQKEALKEPQGSVVNNLEELNNTLSTISPTNICLVGDITLSFFLANNLSFNLGFYDGKTQRKPNQEVEKLISNNPQHFLINDPGTINPEIINIYQSLFKKPNQMIKVKGEEDLIAVALVLLQPLQSVVIYGQPDRGLVIMEISEEKKEQIKLLLQSKNI